VATSTFYIWSNAELPPDALAALRGGTAEHRLVLSDRPGAILATGQPDPAAREAQIIFGQPDVEDVLASQQLRWMHLTTAGYTRYDRDDLRSALRSRGAVMTNSASVFAEPCAQHALAMILAFARALPDAMRDGPRQNWNQAGIRERSFLLSGQVALIVGMGAIGRRLCQMLAPLNMELIGCRRQPRGGEPVPTYPLSDLDGLLPRANHVINILPSAPGTEQFFDADRLGRMRRGAFFYNIGRGDTVDQYALRACLETECMAGAYLDVTTPEPLRPDDPLWTTPNVHITPHTAGGHAAEYLANVSHFIANLRRFESGQPLVDRVM
jgi:phosphoglycerate dehydrogenase-like enzyme